MPLLHTKRSRAAVIVLAQQVEVVDCFDLLPLAAARASPSWRIDL